MRYKYIVLMLAACLSVKAVAQTPMETARVTPYGKVDLAFDTVRFSSVSARPAQTVRYLSNDISFWGLMGSEALGAGTRAYFKLESGFNMDTGTNSGGSARLFDREAYVGYGASWGSVQFGSQFAPSLFLQLKSDPYGRHGNGTGVTLTQQMPGNVRGFNGVATLDNAIQYLSPIVGNVSVRILHALSEKTVAPKDLGEFTGASVEYATGPMFVGIAYEDQTLAGIVPGTTRSNKTFTAGLTYDWKVLKLFSYLMKNRLDGAGDVNAYQVGMNYPWGASTIKATYTTRKIDNVSGGSADTFALGYYYFLSKRTTVYTSLARMNNGAGTNLGLWPSMKSYSPPVAAGGAGLPLGGQDLGSLELGMRHTF